MVDILAARKMPISVGPLPYIAFCRVRLPIWARGSGGYVDAINERVVIGHVAPLARD